MALVAAVVLMVSAGCSTTRRLEEGEVLYNGLKSVAYDKPVAEEPARRVARQHKGCCQCSGQQEDADVLSRSLWVYNNMGSHESGLKKWFYNKFAQEPITVSEIRPEVRTKMIDEILDNNGYFRGTSSYEPCIWKEQAQGKDCIYGQCRQALSARLDRVVARYMPSEPYD